MAAVRPPSTNPPQAPQAGAGGGAVGILGGSGLYDLPGLEDVRDVSVSTPFGEPSAPARVGRLAGRPLVFIPRHGRGHRLLPSEINYRANIHALKQLGVERLISISAVGSLREEIRPGDFVLVDQFLDRTYRRETTFFGDGCAGHLGFADPVCPDLAAVVAQAGGGAQRALHLGGTYVCMEGPQFSTRAEALFHRSLGATVIGMTGATEAKLAREAEMCFSLVAIATDYDCWHPEEQTVTTDAVIEVLRKSLMGAQELLHDSIAAMPGDRPCLCGSAAKNAIMTAQETITPQARQRLRALYGRYFA